MAQQLPTGGNVAAGNATISSPNGRTLNVNQTSDRAIVNWSAFSVGQGATVNFNQPGAASATLNRVTGSTPSSIAGTINAPGTVLLVNPNGIAISKSGVVNVGSFAASTLDIKDSDFMSGKYTFTGNGSSAGVTNAGRINVSDGGFAALLGGQVANDGVISARLGKVGLGSGELITLDLSGDGFLSVGVPTNSLGGIVGSDGHPLVSNKGKIVADGGAVYLSAATAANLLRDAVYVPGTIRANSVGTRDGKIVIGGGAGGKVNVAGKVKANGNKTANGGKIDISGAQVAVSGTVKASGTSGGTVKITATEKVDIAGMVAAKGSTGKGGTVIVTADEVTLGATAKLDVSGSIGGLLLIGGDYQGGANAANNFSIEPVANALTTTVAAGATLTAAGTNGNGGNIVVWSDDKTSFAGALSVASTNGGGGVAEVSGHRLLDFTGTANLAGTSGAGTLLLDPRNITISSGATSGITSGTGSYTSNADDSILNVSTLVSALASGNVVVTTGSSGSQAGNITVADAITWASANKLTLTAAHDIAINAAITATNGGLTINAANAVAATGAINVGQFTLQSGAWVQNSSTLPSFAATSFTISGGSFLRVTGGDGSSGTPYQIADIYGLQGIGSSSAYLSASWQLTNNIDASGTASWNSGAGFVPLGTDGAGNILNGGAGFSGNLDGQYHLVDGLTINRSTPRNGLVGYQTDGAISKIGLTNVNVASGNQTGGLVGWLYSGSVSDSFVTGRVSGGYQVGGLVGQADTGASVLRTYAQAYVSGTGTAVAGLVGQNTGSISQSYAAGRVTGTGSSGLTNNSGGTVTNSYYDTLMFGSTNGDGTGYVTAQMQSALGGFDSNWGVVSGASYFYLKGFYPTAPQVVSGNAYSDNGLTAAAGKSVSALLNGTAIGSAYAGANGYYNILLAAGTIGSNSQLVTYTTGTNAGVSYKQNVSGSTSGLNIFGNTLTETSAASTLSSVSSGLVTAIGSSGVSTALANRSIIATSSNFTIDQAISLTGLLSLSSGGTMTQSSGSSISVASLKIQSITGNANYALTDSGNSFSSLQPGTIGSGSLDLYDSANLSVGSFTANGGLLIRTAGSLTLTGNISSSAAGNAVVLVAGTTFTNSSSSSAISTPNGRWLVYAATPTGSSFNNLNSNNAAIWNSTYANNAPSTIASGNRYVFALQPTLTFTSTNASKYYGQTADVSSNYTVTSNVSTVSGAYTVAAPSTFYTGAPTLSSAGTATTATVAGGPYAINIVQGSVVASGGYALAFANTGTLTVNSATLIIYAGSPNKTYGDTYSSTSNYTASGLYNGDTVTSVTLSSAGAAATANVGNYALTASNAQGTGLSNYSIQYSDGTLRVGQAVLTITAASTSKQYGLTKTFAGSEFTSIGLVNGDTIGSVTLSSTGAAGTANVGSYQINASGATGAAMSNYIIYYNTGSLNVTQAPLTITSGDQAKTYGVAYNLGSTAFSITSGTLYNGNTITGVTLASGAAAATASTGWQTIYASNATGTGVSNYNITYNSTGKLTVNPASLTITANNQSKYYGTVLGSNGQYAITNGTLFNGDTLTGVTLASAGFAGSATVAGGPYAITASNATGTGLYNYTITYVPGTLTVDRAPLTITAGDQSKLYGDTLTLDPTKFTYGQLYNGDTVSSVALASAGTGATAAAGTHAITASNAQGTGLGNYTITYVDGALTVNKASLIIYVSTGATKTYGNTYAGSSSDYSIAGLKNADSVSSVDLTSGGAAATANVGSYSLTGSNAQGVGLSNYNVSYQPGTLYVSPATLTINAANNLTKTYGTNLVFNGTEFTATGLKNSDTISSVSLTSNGAAGTANVGSYQIAASNATGTGLSNYLIYYNTGSLNVTPAPITIAPQDQTKIYGTAYNLGSTAFSITSGALFNGDTITGLTMTSGATAATAAAGWQTIYASNATGTGVSNYNITYSTAGKLTVDPAPLTITANNQSKYYGTVLGSNGQYAITNGTLFNGDTLTGVTLSSAGFAGSATVAGGPYTITANNATGTGLYNYAITYVPGTLTVNKASLTVTAADQSKTYGNTASLGTTGYTVTGNLYNGDNLNGVTLTSAGAAATATVAGGPYAITASNAQGTGLGNYDISYVDGSLTVNKASLIVYGGTPSKGYGTTYSSSSDYTVSGLKNADSITAVDLASAGAAATANVGNYALTASNAQGTGLSNYTISYQPGSLNVSPAILTINAGNGTKVYGSTGSFSGTEFSATGLVNGDTVSSVQLTSAGTAATANVGNYWITSSNAAGTGLSNYLIYYNQGSLSVTQAPLTITAGNQSKVYGSTANLGTTGFSITSGALFNSDTITGVTLTSPGGAPATANVAGYSLFAASATGTGVSNYNITYVPGTLQVTPASLTITAGNQSKTYGDTLNLGSTAYTVTGPLYNGDTVTGVTLASGGTAANAPVSGGPYAIVASNAQGSGLSNYAISYANGALTVDKANLVVTASNASKGYGQTLVFNGTEFISSGLKNGETIGSVALSSAGAAATADVNGSPYAIVASAASGGTFNAGNYNITYVNGALTVTPAALTVTITPNAASKVYGDTLNFAGTEFTQTGLVNGDTISGVTLTSAGAVATAAVGQYDIASSNAVFSSGSALNYNITYNVLANGLTVTPRSLVITASGVSRIYGDANPTTGTATGNTLVNGDTITGVTLSSTATAASGVGGYGLTGSNATGTGLSNYAITYATVANGLTVTPRSLVITANGLSRIYGDANPTSGTATGNNLVNGDTITGVTLSSSATTASSVGSYDLAGSSATGTGLSNYAITYATVANGLTVTPRALVIAANGVSRTYGDATPTAGTAIGNNLVNGDTITGVTLSSSATTASSVGSYDLTGSSATGTGLSNYAITYATVANGLTVTPRSLVITANGVSRTYGDANPTTGTATGNNLVNGDTITGVNLSSPATVASGVGGYDLTGSAATGTGLSNYAITYATVANGLTVTPRALTITVNNVSRTYGDANPTTGTATGNNLVNGDAIAGVNLSSSATTASGVGGYDLTGSNATGTGLSNYAITYATVANGLTVTPRALTITANGVSRIYGDANPTTGTATGNNLVNGDTITGVTLSSSATAASGVGSYDLIGSNATGAGLSNYAITYATVANGLAVTPRSLVITADAISRIYGDANPATGTASGNNLVNGDTITGVTLSSSATAASGVGSYSLSSSNATGTSLSNYTITYNVLTNGLTVTPRALTVTADAQSKTVGDADPLLTYRITTGSLVGSDALTGALTRVAGEGAGLYAILQGSLAASQNYSLAYLGANLTIVAPAATTTPTANGDYFTSRYIASTGATTAPIVNISYQPNAGTTPVISVVSAPRVSANPSTNINVATATPAADPAQNIAPSGGPLALFVPISQFDKGQYASDALPGYAAEAGQAAVLTMVARAGTNNRTEPKINALWGSGGASWTNVNEAIAKTAQFSDGNGTERKPEGDNGFTFVNGTTDIAALLKSGPVMLGGTKPADAALGTPWLLALQITADGKGIIANDPVSGRQIVLAYDAATKTVGSVTGMIDPATRQVVPLGDAAPADNASINIPAAAWSGIKAFKPASYLAVTL